MMKNDDYDDDDDDDDDDGDDDDDNDDDDDHDDDNDYDYDCTLLEHRIVESLKSRPNKSRMTNMATQPCLAASNTSLAIFKMAISI